MITARVIGGKKLVERLHRLGVIDFNPLMEQWERRLDEGNRRGLLAGLDKDGTAMPATQRERGVGSSQRKGSGPPLVPRGTQSRAIRFAQTRHGREGGIYFAELAWPSFDSLDGRPILTMHALAAGAPYPRRDVLGVRPTDMKLMRSDVNTFIRHHLRKAR